MFMSFQVSNFQEISDITDNEVENYKKQLKEVSVKYKGKIEDFFTNIIGNSEALDANKMQDYLFPKNHTHHIFLSHSHQDEQAVIRFALYLKQKFDLDVFIDSCIWGNVFDVLEDIDNRYCKRTDGRYSYNKRNYTTSNLYMILNTALHRKIKETELFLFLGTPNSIKYYQQGDKLQSPWIYSELDFVKNVSISIPKRSPYLSLHVTNESYAEDEDSLKSQKVPFIFYDKPVLENEINFLELQSFLENIPPDIIQTEVLDRLYKKFAHDTYENFKSISNKHIIL